MVKIIIVKKGVKVVITSNYYFHSSAFCKTENVHATEMTPICLLISQNLVIPVYIKVIKPLIQDKTFNYGNITFEFDTT